MPHTQREESKMPDGRPRSQQPRWRQEFPIDTALDEYVARRDFVKFLVLTSGAFVVGQIWIAMRSLIRQGRPAPTPKAIAAIADVPVGAAISASARISPG